MKITVLKSRQTNEYIHVFVRCEPENDLDRRMLASAQATPPDEADLRLVREMAVSDIKGVPLNYRYEEASGMHNDEFNVVFKKLS